jgi:hypothetical protein
MRSRGVMNNNFAGPLSAGAPKDIVVPASRLGRVHKTRLSEGFMSVCEVVCEKGNTGSSIEPRCAFALHEGQNIHKMAGILDTPSRSGLSCGGLRYASHCPLQVQ